MPDAQEQMEHAEHAEHASHSNKGIALMIAVLALILAISEMAGKSAQTSALTLQIESSDLWNFFQAKDIRRTTLNVAADQTNVLAAGLTDPAAKEAVTKQIESWRKTAERYESDPQAGNGRKQLEEKAREAEHERDLSLAKYHHYELSSAAFQVGIVLASAAVITGMAALVWLAGLFGAVGLLLGALGLFAPHAVPFIAAL